jgi:hypothetical protein
MQGVSGWLACASGRDLAIALRYSTVKIEQMTSNMEDKWCSSGDQTPEACVRSPLTGASGRPEG